ncbi:unnamed protein product, partial [Rotaria socialis]
EYFNMIGTIDIINSILGKALGGAAGEYTTGSKALIDLLQQRSRPYLFSDTLPPFVNFSKSCDNHPICPVMLGGARLASRFADEMLKRGIYVIDFSYPVVRKDRARIRVQISAAHSKIDLQQCIQDFAEVERQLEVIK